MKQEKIKELAVLMSTIESHQLEQRSGRSLSVHEALIIERLVARIPECPHPQQATNLEIELRKIFDNNPRLEEIVEEIWNARQNDFPAILRLAFEARKIS